MPKQQTYYEPDAIDCNTIVTSLGNDFGVTPVITTEYVRDEVRVYVHCYKIGGAEASMVQVQAKVSAPLRVRRSLYTMQYSALLDCYHQLDRGLLAVATRPIERDWNGRPKVPRRTEG